MPYGIIVESEVTPALPHGEDSTSRDKSANAIHRLLRFARFSSWALAFPMLRMPALAAVSE